MNAVLENEKTLSKTRKKYRKTYVQVNVDDTVFSFFSPIEYVEDERVILKNRINQKE